MLRVVLPLFDGLVVVVLSGLDVPERCGAAWLRPDDCVVLLVPTLSVALPGVLLVPTLSVDVPGFRLVPTLCGVFADGVPCVLRVVPVRVVPVRVVPVRTVDDVPVLRIVPLRVPVTIRPLASRDIPVALVRRLSVPTRLLKRSLDSERTEDPVGRTACRLPEYG